LYEAITVIAVSTGTTIVPMENVAEVAPGGITTSDGTCASPLLEEIATLAPFDGAAPLSEIVPVTEVPPPTDDELSVIDVT